MIEYKGISELTLIINGKEREIVAYPHETLLSVIRGQLNLSGTKIGCENGDCGACTVLIDGEPMKSCLCLAVEMVGRKITTIEGLKDTAIQSAFIEHGGFQCGFCTAGFLLNAHALLKTHPDASDETKKEWLNSNLCRCTGYEGIKVSVDMVQRQMNKG